MAAPAALALALAAAPALAPALAQAPVQAPAPAPVQAPGPAAPVVAVLQGLDKITARVTEIEAPVGVAVRFGTLEIVVRRCHRRPPEEPPERTAFVDIRERRRGEPPARLFSGWMFASSPAVSALEHPVYDVWVVDCRNASSSDRPRRGSNSAAPSSAWASSRR